MKQLLWFHVVILLFIGALFVGACPADMSEPKQESSVVSAYYASFAGYGIPLKPVEEISEEEAFSRNTYCIGYYDSTNNNLIRFEKYLNGELFFRFEYEYYNNGNIKTSRSINPDGKEQFHLFDENGNRIQD